MGRTKGEGFTFACDGQLTFRGILPLTTLDGLNEASLEINPLAQTARHSPAQDKEWQWTPCWKKMEAKTYQSRRHQNSSSRFCRGVPVKPYLFRHRRPFSICVVPDFRPCGQTTQINTPLHTIHEYHFDSPIQHSTYLYLMSLISNHCFPFHTIQLHLKRYSPHDSRKTHNRSKVICPWRQNTAEALTMLSRHVS